MAHELFKVYRPTQLKDVVGQDDAVDTLKSFIKRKKIPHAILFTGPSGCGKTTLARIMQKKLNCAKSEFYEMNCSDIGGIEKIREIRSRLNYMPMGGDCRIYYIDEAHGLTSAAQDAFLKTLEDTPKHIYFFLATTDPGKLKVTVRTRCTEIGVVPLTPKKLTAIIEHVLAKEKVELSEEVIERIVKVSNGSARKALVILDQIYQLETEEKQLDSILSCDTERQAIDLCRALLNPRSRWVEVASLLKEIKDEAETVRRIILAYMDAVLLGKGKLVSRAFLIIETFRDPFYDGGKAAHAALSACCYSIVTSK